MATTTVSTGLSTNLWATNEKPIDMYPVMFKKYPEMTPLLTMLSRTSERETSQSRIDWTEKPEIPTKVTVTATAASGDTALTIANFAYLRNHYFLYNPKTFELFKVQDTAIDSSVDVIRGWGSSNASAVEAGQVLEILPSSYHEAYDEANPIEVVSENQYNFTSEVVEFVRVSNRVLNEASFFAGKGGKRAEAHQDMFRQFKLKLNKSLYYSYRADTASTQSGYTSNNVKTMGGIVEKLSSGTNYFDAGGVFTETMLEGLLTQMYEQFPDRERLVLVGSPKLIRNINYFAKPLIRLTPDSTKYGLQLNEYQGSINLGLVTDPVLTGRETGTWGFIFDMDYLKLVWQQRPQLILDTYVKRAGYVEDKYTAMMSMIVAVESRHAMIVNAAA